MTTTFPECPCQKCNPDLPMGRLLVSMRFTMCPTCGNKRCPKGTNHSRTCTGSNEPGQAGSSYADL